MPSFIVIMCLFWSTFLMKSNPEPPISDLKYLKMTGVFTFLPLNPSTGLIAPPWIPTTLEQASNAS